MSIEMLDDAVSTADPRIVYRVGRVAFFLAAVAVGLSSMQHALVILTHHPSNAFLLVIMSSAAWGWLVLCPITFGGFFAAFLLLGRWRDAKWISRSILFALIQTYLLVYWCMDNHELLGLPLLFPRRFDMGGLLSMRAIGFVLMLTLGSMAFDVLQRHGRTDSEGLLRATRSVCGIGLSLLTILAFRLYDRGHPWPPRFQGFRFGDPESIHLFMGAIFARPIAGLFVCILCARACATCSRELARMQRAMIDDDPFQSRSDRA